MSYDNEQPPEVTDQDFQALTKQAHELGLHYTGADALELQGFIAMAQAERGADHSVPCYGLSYDPSNRPCRICQMRNPCADLDKSPRVEVADVRHLTDVPCGACRQGELTVELLTLETRELRDYGCTTEGCQNTVGIQCGWEISTKPAEIVLGEPEEKPEEEKEEDAEPASATAESADVSTDGEAAAPPPLSLIEGGKGKKAARKKVTVKARGKKKAVKKTFKKKITVKKAAPKQAAPKEAAPKKVAKRKAAKRKAAKKKKKVGLAFNYDGERYDSLTAIAEIITESRNWSGPKFFKVRAADLRAGDSLQREWEGIQYIVEVSK